MKRIMIIAGEASGDLHASKLTACIRATDPTIELFGIGGTEMKKTGVDVLIDAADLAVVGLFEVFVHRKVIFSALNQMKEILETNPPDILILVDYAEFNLKLAETARKCNVKVLFYISPQVWAWRQGRVKKIREVVDMMAVVFPFEEKFYKEHHIPVRYVGHPLSGNVKSSRDRDTFLNTLGLSADALTIGIFPGSRKSEIKRLLPVFLKAAERLKIRYPEIQFLMPLASTIEPEYISDYLSGHQSLNITLVQDNTYDVINACTSIITVSGTVTLEIALIGTPMVIVNRLSWLSYFIVRMLIKIPYIGLCNIISDRKIVPELIQHEATARNIENVIVRTIKDESFRNEMKTDMQNISNLLEDSNEKSNLCHLVFEMLEA